MKPHLAAEEEAVASAARKFATRTLRARARELDEREEFDREAFREAGELGLCGLMIPEELGGSGVRAVVAGTVLEELGAGSPAFALSLGADFLLFGHNVAREGSADLARKYVPDIAAGRRIGAMALTEAEHGSDAAGITTTAAEGPGGGYRLDGSKNFVTNGPVADRVLVYARTPSTTGARAEVAGFVVERDFPGFETGRPLKKLGNRASPTGELLLRQCPVPAGNRLAPPGKGIPAMMRGLDIERILLPAVYLGALRWALEIAREYAATRRQFGQALSEFQLVRAKLADMATGFEAAKTYLRSVAAEWDRDPGSRGVRGSAAAAKIVVGRAVEAGTREAIQILGGTGYMREATVEMLYRDARLTAIGAGTEEIDQLVVFRELAERGDFL